MLTGRKGDEETEENPNASKNADLDDDDDLYYYSEDEQESPPAKGSPSATLPAVSLSGPSSPPSVQSKTGNMAPSPTVAVNMQASKSPASLPTDKKQYGGPSDRSFGSFPSSPGTVYPKNNVNVPSSPQFIKVPGSKSYTGPPSSPGMTNPSMTKPAQGTQKLPPQKGATPNAAKGAPAPGKKGPLDNCLDSIRNILSPSPSMQYFFLSSFMFYTFVGLLFSILSSPLSQLDQVNGACYTFWGFKDTCSSQSYTYRLATLPCTDYVVRLQVGSAFSIVNIVCMAGLTVIAFQQLSSVRRIRTLARKRLLRSKAKGAPERGVSPGGEEVALTQPPVLEMKNWRYVVLGLLFAAFVCQLICVIVVVLLFSDRPCQNKLLVRTTAYGSGFGLLIVAWALTILAIPFAGLYALRFP